MDPNNNSFIPKRGPVRRTQSVASRQIYLFTLISYVVFFATLVAVIGVFLYGRYIDTQMDQAIATLNTAISGFSDADMEKVREFDVRLKQAENRVENSVSVSALLDAIEDATAKSVKISQLTLERNSDEAMIVVAAIETNSFDSSLFQRGVFERNPVVNSVEVTELKTAGDLSDSEDGPQVSFTATIGVPLSSIPFVGNATSEIQTNPIEESAIETTPTVEDEAVIAPDAEEIESEAATANNETL